MECYKTYTDFKNKYRIFTIVRQESTFFSLLLLKISYIYTHVGLHNTRFGDHRSEPGVTAQSSVPSYCDT